MVGLDLVFFWFRVFRFVCVVGGMFCGYVMFEFFGVCFWWGYLVGDFVDGVEVVWEVFWFWVVNFLVWGKIGGLDRINMLVVFWLLY